MRRILSLVLTFLLAVQQTLPAFAQTPIESQRVSLPAPGVMVHPSAEYDPVMVKGIRVHPENPLQFDFIVDTGSAQLTDEQLKPRAATLIKYFLTSLTVPDDELWVNLSPYEQDRIIPDNFGITDMGRDLLSQDYLLKQLTASLMYPEENVGKHFWDRVYQKSQQLFGNTDISVDTFNKVWVVPEKAKIYLSGDVAFIVESRLKVMMEKDYLALQNNALENQPGELAAAQDRSEQMRVVSEQLIKEVLIPVIEEEVNSGEHFAQLRQIYHSLILATWFKQNLRESYLAKVYVGENKIHGIDIDEKTAKERIYQQYLEAFQTGVYNYVREEFDPELQEVIPRKYFSGGMRFGAETFEAILDVEEVNPDEALIAAREETDGVLRTLPTNVTPVGTADVTEERKDAAILSDTTAVDLGDFITYRKLYLSRGAVQGDEVMDATGDSTVFQSLISAYRKLSSSRELPDGDVLDTVGNPEVFQSLVNAGRDKREPAKIDFLITRQAPIQQSVLELIANAADAITGRSTSIGRFGVGALQMLAFVLDADNPALDDGAHVLVDTKTADGDARRIQFFKGKDGRVKFNVLESNRATTGTAVRIIFPETLNAQTKDLISDFIKERTNLFTKMPVNLNGQLINPLDDHIFLNGDKVRYDFPGSAVNVRITNNEIVVEDSGTGMSDSVILDKYLIPRRGENQDFARALTEEEIINEVHLFYKGPQPAEQRTSSRIVFQVGGINIQSVEIEGYGLPRELIIQLPSTTKLTVSRDKIEIDESTHMAVRAVANKIVKGQPIHQISLINGFMQAVQLLDEVNTRVEALQPLVDTAKEVLIPFVMRQKGLILPNDELFRQMDVPSDTLFLSEALTYKISPDQIPGAESLERAFQPGRFTKAYVVPFKDGADVTFLEAGPYLLFNRAVYEKYKDQPMLLNLRLNYYRGYGRREAPRGTIVIPEEQVEEPTATEVMPLLEEFEGLRAVMTPDQAKWLENYFKRRAEPTLAEIKPLDIASMNLKQTDIERFLRMDRGGSQSSDDKVDRAILSDGDNVGGININRSFTFTSEFMLVNREVDASEERVKALFAQLEAFVVAVPDFMRDRVEWQWLLPMIGATAQGFESLLQRPESIILPDTEFLTVNAAYFLNQDNPDRLARYLHNLLHAAGPVADGRVDQTLHRVLAQLDRSGVEAIDEDVLDTVGQIFQNRNLESMEEAFVGINDALPFVEGDGIKRVITRWLRIYDQDPKAAASFVERLKREYVSQELDDTTPAEFREVRNDLPEGRSVLAPDGKRLVALEGRDLLVQDTATGEEISRATYGRKFATKPFISPDGRFAYVGTSDGGIIKHDLQSPWTDGDFLFPVSDAIDIPATNIKLTPDGRMLVVQFLDGRVRAYDAQRGSLVHTLAEPRDDFRGPVDIEITTTPGMEGQYRAVVIRHDGSLKVYNLGTGEIVNQLTMQRNRATDSSQVLVTPDGTRLIRIGTEIEVWPLDSGGVIKSRPGWFRTSKAAAFTPDGKRLVIQKEDPMNQQFEILVVDIESLDVLDVYEGHDERVTSLTVSPNGRDLVSIGEDGKIKVWELRPPDAADQQFTPTDKPKQVIDTADKNLNQVQFLNDGQSLAVGAVSAVRSIYRAFAAVRPALELRADRDGQQKYLGSPDSNHIVTGDSDGAVRVRNVRTGEIVTQIISANIEVEKIRSVKFVEDSIVIHSVDNFVEVWDRETSELRHEIGPELVALSPNGRYNIISGVQFELRDTHNDRVRMRFKEGQTARFVENASKETLIFVTDSTTNDTTILNLDGSEAGYVIPAMVSVNNNFRLSTDSRFMLVPSRMNAAKWEFWDLKERKMVTTMDGVLRAQIMADLPIAVVERVDAPHIQLVDLETGKVENELNTGLPIDERMRALFQWQVSEDSRYLKYPTGEMTTQVWDLLDNKLVHEVTEPHWTLTIGPDQKHLVLVSPEMTGMSIISLATGEVLREWQPNDGIMESFAVGGRDNLIVTQDQQGVMRVWDWEDLVTPISERSGFAALNPRDSLEGLPSMLRTVVRFLRDEDVTLLEQEETTPRDVTWKVTDRLSEPISLALLNNLYETFARTIQGNPEITFTEFVKMADQLRGRNLSDYIGIIRSAIEGQDKTQRAWVREIAIQNARDATRRAREEQTLAVKEGNIEIRNFMEGDDWVFAVRDRGTGMNLFHLIRYFFPLDQSSKDYLNDTGNLGQGNYTLFADFDRVFIRTSTGDGVIHELEIVQDEQQGPVIDKWEVLSGNEKGTEIRRIKNNQKSDPQLESLFIQEALQRFSGAIMSPEQRAERAEEPNIRDVRVDYNGEAFSDEIDFVASSEIGEQWGVLSLGRAAEKFNQRVIQDGIFIKDPDQKELRFVPKWVLAAFERRGGLHIALPRNIQLNIPRTGYSQEHKFLKQVQIGVLHNMLKAMLSDYVDAGLKIPGIPSDYFDNYIVREQPQAQELVRLLYDGRYDEIDEQVLLSYLDTPTRLFALMSYIPFESIAYDGEMTLHEIRERFISQVKVRRRAQGAVTIDSSTQLKSDFRPRGEFAADIEESVGTLGEIAEGLTSGRLQRMAQDARARTRDPQEVWDRLPENAKLFMDFLVRRFVQPVVGEEMPAISFYDRDDGASARSGVGGMFWNLAYNERVFGRLMQLSENPNELASILAESDEGGALWNFLETLLHETQHLPQFEEPGDHTHHDEAEIEGLDPREDQRFGVRMGRAIDAFLTGLQEDISAELTRSPEEMQRFIAEVDEAARQRQQQQQSDSATLSQSSSQEVGGIDLNPNRIDLEVSGSDGDVSIPLDPTTLETVPVEGFYPVILNVIPTNLPLLLGATTDTEDDGPEQQLISALREEDTLL